jgi:hypothetical protein
LNKLPHPIAEFVEDAARVERADIVASALGVCAEDLPPWAFAG